MKAEAESLGSEHRVFIFSSLEHNMLRVSYCECPVSGVRHPSSTIYLNDISS